MGREGARGEIYSYGLRNPWRFSFDRETGDLTIGDVGQNAVEEIDFVRAGEGAGANFGWRVFEGSDRYTDGEEAEGAIAPVIDESHADGNCSITGGYVIRDPELPSWQRALHLRRPVPRQLRLAELPDGEPRDTRARGRVSCPRSARTPRAASTRCRSTGRSTVCASDESPASARPTRAR